jgi:hypothetical protein
MKLLIQSKGSANQRCDRRCYDAKAGGHCDCCCGGRNHAVGLQKALENIRELFLGKHIEGKSGEGIPKVTRSAERAIERQEFAKERTA